MIIVLTIWNIVAYNTVLSTIFDFKGGKSPMPDENRNGQFSSGFTGLNEAGKTRIEKILSQLSKLPPSRQELPPLCKPPDNELQLKASDEQ